MNGVGRKGDKMRRETQRGREKWARQSGREREGPRAKRKGRGVERGRAAPERAGARPP